MSNISPRATTLALYRSILRIALRMPDHHRTNLIVFRARSEFDASRGLVEASQEQSERWMDAEIYRDNLEHQAEHLSRLAMTSTLVPIDLRSESRESGTPHEAHTCSNPSHNHPASTAAQPRRKLVTAIKAREKNAEGRQRSQVKSSRFMTGPEPSWIAKKAPGRASG
ncbi:BQ5605_C003g02154 [Microbotryum silenes-dioicae]|uniref:BQ5605_C003g02154 protein n=1 Tax=Microbotryum silenes-dioicae TaxID=796604 RepID=A0A2X0M4E1_9BASI|nr:BQ5605_C003g02154 [Microbotryum silenes-dioicae]